MYRSRLRLAEGTGPGIDLFYSVVKGEFGLLLVSDTCSMDDLCVGGEIVARDRL